MIEDIYVEAIFDDYEPCREEYAEGLTCDLPKDHAEHQRHMCWTDLLVTYGARRGVNRQCSIGYHHECSERGESDPGCQCWCHRPPRGGSRR